MGTEYIRSLSPRRRHLPLVAGTALLLATLLAGCVTPDSAAQHSDGNVTVSDKQPPLVHGDPLNGLRADAGDRVYFDYDSATVRSDALPILQKAATWIRQHPGTRIMIEGHADERGTREYNLALGERRAEAVRHVLAGYDVPSAQIAGTVSYGKERPAAVGSSEAAWAQNRRAVMDVE
jgi:peptidoglycan-associated lipoprotein